MSKTSISTNQELLKGDYLLSNNGRYKAIFQDDGNFVVYKWTPIWASDTTSTKPNRIVLQSDASLVMYGKDDTPVWTTGTYSPGVHGNMRLTLTETATLQLTSNAKVLWETGGGK